MGSTDAGMTDTIPRTPQGFGLGLSIVAAVAAAHDATLEITPGEDGGLRVEVGLPCRNFSLLSLESDDAEIVSQSR